MTTEEKSDHWPPLLELRGVTKVYGEGAAAVHALRGIDLRVDNGEFVALMGASGSGKSTCLNILGCLDVPTSGVYLFGGVPVQRLTRDQRAALRRNFIGFVFQGFNLLPRTSALENVELPMIYQGVRASRRRQKAQQALIDVGLEGREHHKPNQLSGGQQQRVAIARALVTDPSVVLADEPTGNLDSKRGHEILQLMARLNRDHGLTIVMVTHEPEMAEYADRIVQFRDGEVSAAPPPLQASA